MEEKIGRSKTAIETGISYSGNRYPEHFKRDLEDIVAHGCTYVVHCYSENDLVYSQKAMGRLFKMTRDTGLGCWADPWGLMKLFGGETFSTFVAHYPDACQVLNNGKRVPAACPSAPETLWTMRLWLDEVISSGATMIFWDEPHLYIPGWDEIRMAPDDAWGCRCPRCRQFFKDEYGSEMPEKMTPEVKAFRQKILLKFLRDMTAYASSKGVTNAVCLLPATEETNESLPWNQVITFTGLKVFGTDPYWMEYNRKVVEFVTEMTRKVVKTCKGQDIQPHIWAQAFKIPKGREQEIAIALETAAKEGASNLAAWGYRGCEPWDGASDQPDVVWDVVGRTFRKLRNLHD